jgi:hypothetical protein
MVRFYPIIALYSSTEPAYVHTYKGKERCGIFYARSQSYDLELQRQRCKSLQRNR